MEKRCQICGQVTDKWIVRECLVIVGHKIKRVQITFCEYHRDRLQEQLDLVEATTTTAYLANHAWKLLEQIQNEN